MKKVICLLFILFTLNFNLLSVWGDVLDYYRIEKSGIGLGANDLGEIAWDGNSLWVTGSGTITKLIGDGHMLYDWITYENMDGFGRGSISSFLAYENTLIASWIYNTTRDDNVFITGDGFSISVDNGETWKHIKVTDFFPPDDYPDRPKDPPGALTVSYDMAVSGNTLWCSITSGFLIKSDDLGQTWTHILPDSDEFDFFNLNHHGYCVEAYGDTLWVGTFQGINASFDAGKTWKNFSWPADGSPNPDKQWPGNWVYAVERRVVNGKTHIWVGSGKELANTGLGINGICHTDDNGETWQYKSTEYNAWNFAFGHDGAGDPDVSDETVLAASDSGLVISHDLGENWELIDIRESEIKAWEKGKRVSSVIVVEDILWVTSSDGLARSNDWGNTWEIFRGMTRVKTLDEGSRDIGLSSNFENIKTYAFPNPFSPKRSDSSYSRTRIQYALTSDAEISIKIYNYNGRLVRELMDSEFRSGGKDYQEIWNGRDSSDAIVPNGVYFYLIKTDKGDTASDKIMVLD